MKNMLLFLFFYFMSLFCFSVNENLVFEYSLDSNKKNTFISFFKISNDSKKRAVIENTDNQQELLLLDESNNLLFKQEIEASFNVKDIAFNSSSTELLVKYSTDENIGIHKFFIYSVLDNKIYKCDKYVFFIEFYGDSLIALVQDDDDSSKYTINLVTIKDNSLLEISEKGDFLADSVLASAFCEEDKKIDFIMEYGNKLLKLEYSIENSLTKITSLTKILGDICNVYMIKNNIYYTAVLGGVLYINICENKIGFSGEIRHLNLIQNIYFINKDTIVLKEKYAEIYFLKNDEIIKSKILFEENKILKESSLSADKKFLALLFDDNSCKIFHTNDEKFSPVIKSHEEIKKIYFDDYNNNLIVIFDKKVKVYNFMPEDVNPIGQKRKFNSEIEQEKSKKSKLE